MNKKLFIIVLCVLIQGCVTTSTLKLAPQVLTGQKEVSQEGVNGVVSEKKVHVTVRPSTSTFASEDRPTIVVGVYSTGESFDFSTDNIQVFVDGNPHRVFTYAQLVADIKAQKEKEEAKIVARKDSDYMTGGGGGGMDTTSANFQMNSRLSALDKKTEKSLKDLNATALRNITVMPNTQYSGYVTIEKIPNPSQPHDIKVIVTVVGEKHEFLLKQTMI